MATDELMESWKRTEGLLLDARSHFSEAAEAVCFDELQEFSNYLEHNELELALDMLDVAIEKSGFESSRILEFMALAAASMGLGDRQQRFDDQSSKGRG
jgi:hypothetical protein